MSTSLTNDEIQTLREIRIHKILSVQDNGRRVSIRCPFHNERTPSFILYPDNSYHCYGCGLGGSGAIDFCISLGYTFLDSAEELSKYI